jgi:hypothetical protein
MKDWPPIGCEIMKNKTRISHDEVMVKKLQDHPRFAAEYLKAALEDMDEPEVLLIALGQIAERLAAGWPKSPRLRGSSGKAFIGHSRLTAIRGYRR